MPIYEAYKFFNEALKLQLSNKIIIGGIVKLMKLMIPFVPHLAHECLSNLKCQTINKWPDINKEIFDNIKVNLVVQINGKTRDVLNVQKDIAETELNKLIKVSAKASKYLNNKKIIKTIFVKNKIINYIIKN